MLLTINRINYSTPRALPKNGQNSYQYILTRLLIGAMHIEYNSARYNQNINYSTTPACLQADPPARAFGVFLQNYNFNCTTSAFIKNSIPNNRGFFADLLSEFSHYFIQKSLGANTSSFIYLYRILERISYSTPLLYSKKSHDYLATFNELKRLFENNTGGDYGLFNKFLQQGNFVDGAILDTTYTIDFSLHQDKADYFRVLKGVFSRFELEDQSTHQFRIKFREVAGLLVNVRNRFFHMRTGDGQHNIATKDLGDPEKFFSVINETVSSFLAIVTLHIIEASINRY